MVCIVKYIAVFLIICYNVYAYGQATWFKHLPGFYAKNSLIKGDTILTVGVKAELKSFGNKYSCFLSWNNNNADSIGFFNINLDTLVSDTTSSTLFSSFYSGMIDSKSGIFLLLGQGLGLSKTSTYLMSFKDFYPNSYQLIDFTLDTFGTTIDEVLPLNEDFITTIHYLVVDNPFEGSANTIIYKGENKRKIKEYFDRKSEKYHTSHYIKNNNSDASFFFKFTKKWNYLGDPQQWEDYIIKMDTTGKEIWKTNPNTDYKINPVGMTFVQKTNGNLLVSWVDRYYRPYLDPYRQSDVYGVNRKNTLWFSEIDSLGNILGRKNITKFLQYKLKRDSSFNIQIEKALPVNDGVLWVGYNTWYYRHAMLLKTDYNGNPIWLREYELYPSNTAKNEFLPTDIVQTSDKGFVITGEYTSSKGNIFPDRIQKGTILKVDSFGCLEPGCQLNDSIPQEDTIKTSTASFSKKTCKVYPNPTNSTLNLDFDGNEEYHLKLISLDGKVEIESFAKNKTVVNIEQLKSGVYFLHLYNQSRSNHEVHKVIVINN